MIKINEELRNLLFGLSKESYQLLEESLLEEGCRDPIILWNNTIVDGHNRYEICQKHNIEFLTIQKEFDNIEDVKQWMLINQAGRRNLDIDQLKITIGKIYNSSKQIGFKFKLHDSDNLSETELNSTSEKIAKNYGISSRTVERYGKIADEYDKLEVDQPELFEQVKSGEITIQEAKKQIKRETLKEKQEEYNKKIEEQASLPEEEKEKTNSINIHNTDKKFRVIYADPPWKYDDAQNNPNLGGAEKHYNTMSIKELCELPVKDITEKDAVLFLWVTSPKLNECWDVIEAWGFAYKTSFVWDKVKHNMGHYNSVRHELLLICGKGKSTPDIQKLYDSVQVIERSDVHSEKPIEFINIIDDLYIYGNRIELFARATKKEGWYYWGNEI